MGQLTSPRILRDILKKYGIQPRKSLGQNFLIDQNILGKIVDGAEITERDNVLEIGPGVGTLTQELAARAKKVVAVETDKSLLPILNETLGHVSNFTVIHGDILKIDIKELVDEAFNSKDFKVVANLPYYITTPIIMRFLEEELPFTTLTIMIQKEVAQRIAANPGEKEYGALSVAVQFYTKVRKVCHVSSKVFMPQPRVDSMVISLDRLDKPPAKVQDKAFFFKVVRGAFAQRRKTLLNNLTSGEFMEWDRDVVVGILDAVGIDAQRRGETLGINEFAKIANYMTALSPK